MSDGIFASGLEVYYDRNSDVLYVSRRPGVPARSEEEAPGVVWRYDAKRGDLIGVTIIDFDLYWRRHKPELVEQIASRFSLSHRVARQVLDSVT